MFYNYFKIATRNLIRHKTFSLINIFGLSIGIAAFMMVSLWVHNEFQYNQFHDNADRLYRVLSNQQYSEGQIMTINATPGLLSKAIKEEIPEVSLSARTTWRMSKELTYQNVTAVERGYYADEAFLKMFTFPLKKGTIEFALAEPKNIVISQKVADKYFGDEAPMGQTLSINDEAYKVSGILEEIPTVSSLKFDFLLPFKDFEANNEWLGNWGENGIHTWVMLKKQTSLTDVSQKIGGVLKKNGRQQNSDLMMQSIQDMYLYSDFKNGQYAGGGNIKNVRLFSLIGLMILLIACINFMNLTTARSRNRAKEIGVRKAIGAERSSLIYQFFTESFLMTLVAVLIAVLIVDICLPLINDLTANTISTPYNQPFFWLSLGGVFLTTALLSGTYPALVLSNFRPLDALSQRFKLSAGDNYFRKGMVIGQFAIAILLIIGTGVVFNQLHFMQHKDLGYNKDQLLYIPVKSETLRKNYTALKTELEQMPEVQSVSSGSHRLSLIGSSTGSISWEGKDPEENIMFVIFGTNFDILKTIDAEILNGRDFSSTYSTDSDNFIINEAAAKAMGLDQPVGENLNWGEHTGQIVGLVKDFHISPVKYSIDPAIMYISPEQLNHVYVKVETKEMAATLTKLETALATYNPNQTFDYEFASDDYARFYQSEKTVSKLSSVFASIAIFICCLGLFGLALFTIEQRTREIGIRKILGATTTSLVSLLSKDFLKLVLIAMLIALPIAWYYSNQWLQDFHYRIDTPWQLFMVAGSLALLVAFITVSTQSIRAALANPIKALRNE